MTVKFANSLALLMILAGCGMATGPDPAQNEIPGDLPEGTVRVGENMYMVPLDVPDADGCVLYRRHSPGKLVTQEIQYRRADGSFTPDKQEAACLSDDT